MEDTGQSCWFRIPTISKQWSDFQERILIFPLVYYFQTLLSFEVDNFVAFSVGSTGKGRKWTAFSSIGQDSQLEVLTPSQVGELGVCLNCWPLIFPQDFKLPSKLLCTKRYSWHLSEDPRFDFNSSVAKPIVRTDKLRPPPPFRLQVEEIHLYNVRKNTSLKCAKTIHFSQCGKSHPGTQVHTGVRSFVLPHAFVNFLLRHPVATSKGNELCIHWDCNVFT